MKNIVLTQGKAAIVDDEDFEYLSQWTWCFSNEGYARRSRKLSDPPGGRAVYMHRVIHQTEAGLQTDHINRNPLDNRKKNLRTVTKQQNQFNSNSSRNSSSRFKGVSWYNRGQKWRVQIMVNNKQIHIGCYISEQEAALAYNTKAKELHGEFAGLNILDGG